MLDIIVHNRHASHGGNGNREDVQETVQVVRNSENREKSAHDAGNQGHSRALLIFCSGEVEQGEPGGVSVGDIGGPGRQYQDQHAQNGTSNAGKHGDDAAGIHAQRSRVDRQDAAGQERSHAHGNHADNAGDHHVFAAFAVPGRIARENASGGESAQYGTHSRHHGHACRRNIIANRLGRRWVAEYHDHGIGQNYNQGGNGDDVQPLDQVNAYHGGDAHNRPPQNRGQKPGKRNAECIENTRKRLSAERRLEPEPADKAKRYNRGNDITASLFAKRAGDGHHRRDAQIGGLDAHQNHHDHADAVGNHHRQERLGKGEPGGDDSAHHQSRNAADGARPDERNLPPALLVLLLDLAQPRSLDCFFCHN